ncbi:hypothetical protein KCH_28570 [Kitasatospora cheerisanensis KCTC 2395]|uniref:Uncharacterized protein n=2 Tax=Kitasatospora cheerisanensis TaxID=81942 RepID=A0A066Z4K9_9ACTN|nr:hypothetical protein KCH_28570 [Kitasatospora cheerisanensis KCTC 2395]
MPSKPPVPPMPTFRPGQVEVRVERQLLWIGQAAYPLHNIARVFPVVLYPRSAEAFARFGRRVGITLVSAFLVVGVGQLSIATTSSRSTRSDTSSAFTQFVVSVAVVALILYVVELLRVVLQKPQHVVAIETNGSSVALITAADAERRRALTEYIAAAVDNPQSSLLLHVDTLAVNPANYYFGDTVNVHGTGNVGRIST